MTMTMPTAQGAPAAAAPARAGSSAKDDPAAGTGFAAALTAADAAAPAAGRGPARGKDGGPTASTTTAESGAVADATTSEPTAGQPVPSQTVPTQPVQPAPAPADAGALAALLGLPVAAPAAAPSAAAPSLAAAAPSLAVGDGSRAPERENGRVARDSAAALAGAALPVSGRAAQPSLVEGDTPRAVHGEIARAARVSPSGAGVAVGAGAAGPAPSGPAPVVAGGLPATPATGAPSLVLSDTPRAAQTENGRGARVSPTVTPPTAPAAPTPAAAPTTAPQHGADAIVRTQGESSLQAGPTARTPEATFALPAPTATAPTATGPTTTAPTTAPAVQPAPLAQQLARPVFTLAQAGHGDHVVTVQVVPDTLGPVTVRAHVTAQGMHVELFAASDAGRDAVRQVLPDLRRDAAATGVATTLDLSSQNHPDRQAGESAGRDGRPAAGPPVGDDLEARPASARTLRSVPSTVRTAGLDVLA
ncbi:flagellar hook-length control protein FliK [Curtobacterium sp. L3-7]|uniref:flagellar hook-length control protein FliK n=1 Tax=Curtobacterium sp. L3-7 TaxID=3138787 RepID=UPI003B51DEDF